MSFDGFYMHHINKELQSTIVNGKVIKIHQPNDFELVCHIRSHNKNYKLLFNINASSARYHLTNDKFVNPNHPPNFCMVLRKYLEGAILLNIQQLELDRTSTFIFKRLTELHDTQILHLSVEIMGKHSNITLLFPDTNKIIDCMKHVPPSKNTYRILLPNATYILPPQQHNINIFNTTLQKVTDTLNGLVTIKEIQHHFQGFSQPFLKALQNHAQINNIPLHNIFNELIHYDTNATLNDSSFFPIAIAKGTTFATLSDSLDVFYRKKSEKDRIKQSYSLLFQRLNALIHKNQQKIKNITLDLNNANNADIFRIKGELLMANHYAIARGQHIVTLNNFYDEDKPIAIDLKPEKNALQNAKDYFKKYQKLKQSYHVLNEQLQKTTEELNYLESVFVQINHANLLDLEAIKHELIETGYIRVTQKSKRQQKPKTTELLTYFSTDNTKILVGKNNLQNDQLTLKLANKTDIWLHAKNIPGSHVVITSDQPSESTLYQAAMIAAYHSKFQHSANVPVDYVTVKHIKKPNGAKPGFVIYDNQKTLVVTPEEQLILSLKESRN